MTTKTPTATATATLTGTEGHDGVYRFLYFMTSDDEIVHDPSQYTGDKRLRVVLARDGKGVPLVTLRDVEVELLTGDPTTDGGTSG